MYTDVEIINLGLAKIAQSKITRIDPPQSALERHCATVYPMCRRSELTKRRWVFALVDNFVLPQVDYVADTERGYKYSLPTDCLRPLRAKSTEWVQRGRFIWSAYSGLRIPYIKNVLEADFDPLFVDVLAERVAVESVEFVTQSNTKAAARAQGYKDAVAVAGQANAFIIGNEDPSNEDEDFPFLTARWNQ